MFDSYNLLNKILSFYHQAQKQIKIEDSQWQLWCKPRKTLKEKEWVIIESILTQQTNWNNVEQAMANLENAKKDSLLAIYQTPSNKLKILIRPAGFYQIKAKYLKNVAKFFIQKGGIKNIEKEPAYILRNQLLQIKGVGFETADSILLYAFNRLVFVVDAYTKRWIKEFKIRIPSGKRNYSELQKYFVKKIPKNVFLYQKIHAIIVLYYKNKLKISL